MRVVAVVGANSTFCGTIAGLTPGTTYNVFVVALQQAETNVGASETITFTA
jgi:TctA family transporter